AHAFRFFHRAPDRTHRRVQVHDQALAQPFGLCRAQRQEFHLLVHKLRDQRARLRAADIQSDDVPVLLRQGPHSPSFNSNVSKNPSYLAFAAPACVAPHALVSGFTTTCRANCRSMLCTQPAFACHCAKFSTSIRYFLTKSSCPKCTVTACEAF